MRSSDWSSDVCSADLQSEHRAGVPHRCLADFVAPASSGLHDYVGAFAVTTGIGAAERIAAFRKANDDYSAIILEALADRLAEAFAERLPQLLRKEFWGYAADQRLNKAERIAAQKSEERRGR